MVKVRFIDADGAHKEIEAEPGANLLEVAQAAGMPLEGTCEGQMACSTCHVVIGADWFGMLQPASEEEEDMLDLAAGVTARSRLSCQIDVAPALDGIEVHIPALWNDMQRG